jgi:hypothetical protein
MIEDEKISTCEEVKMADRFPLFEKHFAQTLSGSKKDSNSVSFKLYSYKQPLPQLASNPSAACSSAGQEDSAGTTDLRPQL